MSDWREIIKAKGKLVSSSKGIDLDIQPTPKKPKDKSCNQKLKEYSEYLLKRDSIMFEFNKGENFKSLHNKKYGPTKEVDIDEKYTERIIAQYRPLPEEVACKALEYLEDDSSNDIEYRSFKDNSGVEWVIGWLVQDEYDELMVDTLDADDAAAVLIVSKRDDENLPYEVYLSHRIILWDYSSYSDKEKEILNKIDWR